MSNHGQKSGPMSKAEKGFIIDNCESMSIQDIATALKRNVNTIQKFVEKNVGTTGAVSPTDVFSAQKSIKTSPVWTELKEQFTPAELDVFLYHWSRLISQFNDDVYPTEELQIIEYIRTMLLTNRVLKRHRQNLNELEALEDELAQELNMDVDIQDLSKIASLRALINGLRAAQDTNLKDYKDLIDKKSRQETALKGTRDQRITEIEKKGTTLTGLIKELTFNKEYREKVGRDMEKMRLAADAEIIRLSELHKYEDGAIDIPFLTPQTVRRHNIINKEEDEDE